MNGLTERLKLLNDWQTGLPQLRSPKKRVKWPHRSLANGRWGQDRSVWTVLLDLPDSLAPEQESLVLRGMWRVW